MASSARPHHLDRATHRALPRLQPAGVVLPPGRVAGAVVVDVQRGQALLRQLLTQSAVRTTNGLGFDAEGRAEHYGAPGDPASGVYNRAKSGRPGGPNQSA